MNQNHTELIHSAINEAEKTILGKREVIELTLTGILANGHLLFDDIPGVGKTLLVRTFAKILNLSFARIQFTPDLMPSDILGVTIYNQNNHSFEFKQGPIFNSIILADEINRTSPKTQSALLEVMSEKQVSIDSSTYKMDENFFVLATQNPLNFEGTYPLPEAQLDRFIMQLHIGYPSFDDELNLIKKTNHEASLGCVNSVLNHDSLQSLMKAVEMVEIKESVYLYALKLVRATRHHPDIILGISPRGAQQFIKAAKAYALVKGRNYCIPEDFITLMKPVFSHRIQKRYKDISIDSLLEAIKKAVVAPDFKQ